MNKKNVILGLIKNYDWVDLEPFVSTLQKSGYSGKTLFFYNNIADITLEKLASFGIELVHFEETFPYLGEKYIKDMGMLAGNPVMEKNFFSFRYIIYYLFLRNEEEKYDNIMLTDIRDVVFQKDPFDFEIDGKLCCFLESEKWPIKRSEHNAVGIMRSYGQEELDKIGDNLIACAGTIIGAELAMKNYVTKLLEEFMRLKNKYADDQFIFNYLLWNELLPEAVTFKNHHSPVLTLGYEKKVYTNKAGQITDKFGVVVNTIHQYDRHFFTQLKYGSPTFKWRSSIKLIKVKIYQKFIMGFIRKISPKLFLKIRAFIKRKKK